MHTGEQVCDLKDPTNSPEQLHSFLCTQFVRLLFIAAFCFRTCRERLPFSLFLSSSDFQAALALADPSNVETELSCRHTLALLWPINTFYNATQSEHPQF